MMIMLKLVMMIISSSIMFDWGYNSCHYRAEKPRYDEELDLPDRRTAGKRNRIVEVQGRISKIAQLKNKANRHKSRAPSLQRQTDRQTDRRTEWFIESRARD